MTCNNSLAADRAKNVPSFSVRTESLPSREMRQPPRYRRSIGSSSLYLSASNDRVSIDSDTDLNQKCVKFTGFGDDRV